MANRPAPRRTPAQRNRTAETRQGQQEQPEKKAPARKQQKEEARDDARG